MAIIGKFKRARRRISFIGKREVIFELEKIESKIDKAIAVAMVNEATQILLESKILVPKDTGNLMKTGHITDIRKRAGRLAIEVKYGGSKAPYAVIQHENMEFSHDPPRQAKYLEQPFKKRKRGMAARIGTAISIGMKKTGGVPPGFQRPESIDPITISSPSFETGGLGRQSP